MQMTLNNYYKVVNPSRPSLERLPSCFPPSCEGIKQVWHSVLVSDLTRDERDKIIRCSMFRKEKFTTSIEYDKLNARLVAGGDQQDKKLYKDLSLSSPTESATSALDVTVIAACDEGISVDIMDNGGVFPSADISSAGLKVHMRLNRVVTGFLAHIRPNHGLGFRV